MNKSKKIVLYAACVSASLVQGWIVLKFYAVGVWLMYFGISTF